MKTSFGKSIVRTYLVNKGRFLANFLTVLLSVAITAGLSALPEGFSASFLKNYENAITPDIILKSKMKTGFGNEDIEIIKSNEKIELLQEFFVIDAKEEDGTYNRFYVYDFASASIAKPVITIGEYPANRGEAIFLTPSRKMAKHQLGEQLTFTHGNPFLPSSLTLLGEAQSPLYNSQSRERAELEDQDNVQYVDSIFFLDRSTMPRFSQSMFTDIYVRLNIPHDYYAKGYQQRVNAIKEELIAALGSSRVAALTLEENTSYALFKNYNDKITLIGYIFPFFFLVLCALINHIGITRLIKDERAAIAVYASSGVPKHKVVFKYSFFITLAVLAGGIIGYLLGAPLLPFAVYPAYTSVFRMNGCPVTFAAPIGLVTIFVLTAIALGLAIFSSLSYLKEEPSDLLHDKAPVVGKKIWMERIPFLWRPIPFSFKSTFRNIFRQKKNFVLTTFAVIGSTLILLAGFALLNVSNALTDHELYADVASSMGLISTVLVLFALGMAFPTIYSLASMNIADRKRELATLKVLGYTDWQCMGYTFREIIFITIFATLIGVPISAFIVDFVLRYLEFGSLQDVQWWSYVITAALEIGLSVGINFLLYPRIIAIDINDSLKSIE